ncbi:hypothetical protein HYH02_003670 [Chlamydomonas schloesseri]|uniref:Uncharacterized protein n=1 Tax=Chlamydomonas schloesseri TaxID=2026947 RepID=A0A836BA46_9CHLO|nr:hypothetical protein HYH02_003670 [Chlamydomonas schloesseri]|eukprot:KAG2451895.1 hypothetical protein HYH02_003670 [Chlamydomonas schloesseri]
MAKGLWLGAGSLLAGLIAALTSRLTRRRRRKHAVTDAAEPAAEEASTSGAHERIGGGGTGAAGSQQTGPAPTPWVTLGARASFAVGECGLGGGGGGGGYLKRTSDGLLVGPGPSPGPGPGPGPGGSTSSGVLSRLMVLGRPSESVESAVSFSGDVATSSTNNCAGYGDEYDSSEEQEPECSADSARAYGKSDRARLVDMWIESALLVSRDVRLDKRHFDRTTRQNLKKMRPASAQAVLAELAERSWDGTADIAKEVHRLVSHAKAQDKFAVGSAMGAAALVTTTSHNSRTSISSSSGGGGGLPASAAATAAAAAAVAAVGGSRLVSPGVTN